MIGYLRFYLFVFLVLCCTGFLCWARWEFQLRKEKELMISDILKQKELDIAAILKQKELDIAEILEEQKQARNKLISDSREDFEDKEQKIRALEATLSEVHRKYGKLSEKTSKWIEEYKSMRHQYKERICAINTDLIETQQKLNDTQNKYDDIIRTVSNKEAVQCEINDLNKQITTLTSDLLQESIKITDYENITSEECKNKLLILKHQYNEMLKNLEIVDTNANIVGNKRANKNSIRQMFACFEAESQIIIDGLTFKNADTARSKLQRSFDKINSMFATDGIQLSNTALEYKLNELSLVYAYIVKKEDEKEEQKAIRAQMVEEERVRRELEREKLKLQKEEHQFKNEISKLMTYMQKASDIEKQLYVDKIRELEEKLPEIEKSREDVTQREQNTRAGFVYVISNIGSFGEDVYKIGMTRRLEPMDRIRELGDASVPFDFDVHAMIFSSDAPALEAILHNTFKKNQVNKVNPRKEFFKVSLDDIEKVVKENYNATITFTKVAEALQYRESLKMAAQAS